MTEENDKIFGFIGIIILVVVIVIAMNFIGPTIGNTFPDPLGGSTLDWDCIERNGCDHCGELQWDTSWCYECALKCSISPDEQRQGESVNWGLIFFIFCSLIVFVVYRIGIERKKETSWIEIDENDFKNQERDERKFDPAGFIIAVVLVGAIVLIAMNFLGPTIGNVFCNHDDMCCGTFCSGIINYCDPFPFLENLPKGKLVLIAPKVTVNKTIRIIGFAYSPSVYFDEEVYEIKQQYLKELGLLESEANIVELDITMGEKGYLSIPTYIDACDSENNRYTVGENLFIDPNGLTVWHLKYQIKNPKQSRHNITISFVHDDPVFIEKTENRPELRPCGFLCGSVDGRVSIEVQKISLLEWIQNVRFFYAPEEDLFNDAQGKKKPIETEDSSQELGQIETTQDNDTQEENEPSETEDSSQGLDRNYEIRVISERVLEAHNDAIYSVAWSPDGTQLASAGKDNQIIIWDVESGAINNFLLGHSAPVWAAIWSPDGEKLASTGEDGTIRIWDPNTGALILKFDGNYRWAYTISWSPDGRYFATGSYDGIIRIWDASYGNLINSLNGRGLAVWGVDWAQSGNFLASSHGDGRVRIWDVNSGEIVETFNANTENVYSVTWSNDERMVVTSSKDSNVIQVWQLGSGLLVTNQLQYGSWCADWSPTNNDVYISGDSKIRFWDLQTGIQIYEMGIEGVGYYAVDWSPDGQKIAAGASDGNVYIWEIVFPQ